MSLQWKGTTGSLFVPKPDHIEPANENKLPQPLCTRAPTQGLPFSGSVILAASAESPAPAFLWGFVMCWWSACARPCPPPVHPQSHHPPNAPQGLLSSQCVYRWDNAETAGCFRTQGDTNMDVFSHRKANPLAVHVRFGFCFSWKATSNEWDEILCTFNSALA